MNQETTPCRDSFVFYRSFNESIKGLPDVVQLALFRAVVAYGLDQLTPDFTGVPQKPFVEAIFAGIRPQLDANHKRFLNGYKGKEYGRLGGAPKGNTNARKQPQNNPKTTPNVNVNENVNGNVKGAGGTELILPFPDKSFVDTWNVLKSQPKWKHKTVRALKMALNQLAKYDVRFAVTLMESAIVGNYQGVTFSDTPERYQRWLQANQVSATPDQGNGRMVTNDFNPYE
jgi:hypothetical protein